jgi:DNA-binding HxlR family transcriptional regulator
VSVLEKYQMCPKFEAAFELLGKKWTGLIIRTLLSGQKRFSVIAETIPNMSARMLTERFKELEKEGIVIRKVYPETPVLIEYELTEKGKELEAVMNEIQNWAEKWNC